MKPKKRNSLNPGRIAGLIAISTAGLAALPKTDSKEERAEVAARFRFTRTALPALHSRPASDTLDVIPAIAHFGPYLAAILGAGVSINDLDGDGLPNDICESDVRSRDVVITGAPGTPERYAPFVLEMGALFDPVTMVPTGCRTGDFNEDGLVDLLVGFAGRTPLVFLQRLGEDGSRLPLSAKAFAVRELIPGSQEVWNTSPVALTDIDGDGHLDLVIGNYFPDGARLFDPHQVGMGGFEMNDSYSHARNGGTSMVFLWKAATAGAEPSVTFERAPNPFHGEDVHGWPHGIAAVDLDKDGLSDLYIAEDFGSDLMYLNRSTPGHVEFVPLFGETSSTLLKSKSVGRDSYKGMGVDVSDVNGDGIFDIFVSNLTSDWGLLESHFLWMSTGEKGAIERGVAPYREMSESMGVARTSWAWDAKFADFDNDGLDELVQSNGLQKGTDGKNGWAAFQDLGFGNDLMVKNPMAWPPLRKGENLDGDGWNAFFARSQDGRFIDVSRELETAGPWNGRAVAVADVDGDGRIDMAFGNQFEDAQFFHNESPSKDRFLGLHVLLPLATSPRASTSIRDGHPTSRLDGYAAVGAFLTLHHPDGRIAIRQIDCTNGHAGGRSPEAHFGLGTVAESQKMNVDLVWRDAGGALHSETVTTTPGWHTVLLGAVQQKGADR